MHGVGWRWLGPGKEKLRSRNGGQWLQGGDSAHSGSSPVSGRALVSLRAMVIDRGSARGTTRPVAAGGRRRRGQAQRQATGRPLAPESRDHAQAPTRRAARQPEVAHFVTLPRSPNGPEPRSPQSRGEPSVPDVARRLAVAPRTLQRRLAAEGVSYQEVMDDTRRETAEHPLTDASLAVSEIA